MPSDEFLNYALGAAAIIAAGALVYVAIRIGEVCRASRAVLQHVEALTKSVRETESAVISFAKRVIDFFA